MDTATIAIIIFLATGLSASGNNGILNILIACIIVLFKAIGAIVFTQ